MGVPGHLVEIDDPAVADAQLHRLIARLDVAVHQKAVVDPGPDQPLHQAFVVQHVAIHQQHGFTPLHHRFRDPERDNAALGESRVLDEGDPNSRFDPRHLVPDLIGGEAHDDEDLVDPAGFQDGEMPFQ
jgi:hypothetical protein